MSLPFASRHTGSFPDALRQLGVSVVVSTYQAGRLIILRQHGEALNTHFCALDRPMGVAAAGGRLAVGTGHQVIEYFDVPAVGSKLPDSGSADACYLPRQIQITGDIDIHEMAYAADGELWLVNTRMSCLCTRDPAYSIRPRWRPAFISGYDLTDRCHLNGLAMRDGRPSFVTALGASDQPGGWRADKASGGILMSVPDGRVVAERLSMPHSPRWHLDRLWVLESGAGALLEVDPATGEKSLVADLPGFTRGLDFIGRYAFIGLSQVRESAVFAGLPLTARVAERQCGVWIVDTATGTVIGFVVFTGSVQEIFAVQVVPHRHPTVLDLGDELLRSTYSLPDEALAEVMPVDPLRAAIADAASARRRGDTDAAIESLNRVLAQCPGKPEASHELSLIHMDRADWPAAIPLLRSIVERQPAHAEAANQLGLCYAAQGSWRDALSWYEVALAADSRYAAAHVNRGVALFAEGNYRDGWREWEWRRELPDAVRFACPQPEWRGEPIDDKVLLIDAAHGLDATDVIQFARFLSTVSTRCARVIVTCRAEMRSLLNRVQGVADARVPDAIGLDRFDVYCSLLSLPHRLGITREDLPGPVPYLSLAEHGSMDDAAASGQLRIGLCWSPAAGIGHLDGLTLSGFSRLIDARAARWFSFGQGVSRDEANWLEAHGVVDLEGEIGSAARMAAWVGRMDIVVGVDRPMVHLAGALSKPAIVLLDAVYHWRWRGAGRDNSWYPSVYAVRRGQSEDWESVISRLDAVLDGMLPGSRGQG